MELQRSSSIVSIGAEAGGGAGVGSDHALAPTPTTDSDPASTPTPTTSLTPYQSPHLLLLLR